MKNSREQTRFTIEYTHDGSPTLRLPNGGESMHHSGGAASETEYIYKSVIESSLKVIPNSKLCVVGLGLGYIEISWALSMIKNKLFESSASFISYESEMELKESFNNWLTEEVNTNNLYDQVTKSLINFEWTSSQMELISLVKKLIKENIIKYPFKNNLESELDVNNSFNIICYDAFSSKTNTSLWSEDFLNKFITNSCAPDCVFTTYACTGILKKVLKQHGFKMYNRLGFMGKRDSTLATRGIFSSSEKICFQTS